jgi:hypothetical protein
VVQTNIDLIKIDIEGNEYRAIQGAAGTIRRSTPVIVSEFSVCGLEAISRVEPEMYLELLRSFGYRIRVVGERTASTNREILDMARDVHHIDILAEPA